MAGVTVEEAGGKVRRRQMIQCVKKKQVKK